MREQVSLVILTFIILTGLYLMVGLTLLGSIGASIATLLIMLYIHLP
jgi:hypothetical protein